MKVIKATSAKPSAYRFLDRWVVDAPIDAVYNTIGDVLGYERGVATLDWCPSVNHALIRYLTPALRPLFRSNHNWAMRHGERQIREYLHAAGAAAG